jgi:cytochrome c-type biogenesis protein CcmF
MSSGTFLLIIAFIFSVISAYYYWKVYSISNREKIPVQQIAFINYARTGYYISTLIIVFASIFLWFLIFTNKFQYSYVANYSSRELPFLFKISAFWAGQQGSFLFWTLVLSLLGILFQKHAGKFEPLGMSIVNGIILFFIIIMWKANPFARLPVVPANGSGLNPLLQNFWMAIHPPVLFVGYAAASFPFALAISAFIQRSFHEWVPIARKWAIFSSFALGAGIIIGAFWAYEVLGWGGYWGWDPVENSSLVPWLLILALIHGFILQKRNQQFVRTNFWLATFSFLFVLYATFLTRSGILADFSVHSFQDNGLAGLLIAFMGFFLGVSIFTYTRVASSISTQKYSTFTISKEFMIFLSLFVLTGSAVLIIIGTSYPIISGFFGSPTKVDISFYNITNLPLALLGSILLLLVSILRWNQMKMSIRFYQLIIGVFAGIIAMSLAFTMGIHNPLLLLLLFFSMTTIFLLLYNLISTKSFHASRIGGIVSHLGVVIFFVGMIINGNLKTTEQLILPQHEPVQFQNKQFTYHGYEKSPDGKDFVRVVSHAENSQELIRPRFYFSRYNNAYMREPYIQRYFLYDIYYSPIQIQSGKESGKHLIIGKKEKKQLDDLHIEFVRFHMDQHGEGNEIKVGAELNVMKGNQQFTVIPAVVYSAGKQKSVPGELIISSRPEEKYVFALEGIDADSKKIKIHIDSSAETVDSKEMLIMEVKNEPFIGFVWLGFFLIILGNGLPVLLKERS